LGVGRIERHGEPDDFRWLVEGRENVQRVLDLVSSSLSPVKLEQARRALERFDMQPRVRGDRLRCVRGHTYDAVRERNGRVRRRCNSCARLIARRRRAAQGIAPRRFTNAARRYTF
jgi:hypothetical protein